MRYDKIILHVLIIIHQPIMT